MDINIISLNKRDSFQLEADPSKNVYFLKMKIDFIYNIPFENQTLAYNNCVMKNSRILSSYNIKEGANIYLIEAYGSEAFRINCKQSDGEILELKVDPYTTIYDIKCMIEALDKTNPDYQHITYKGEALNNSSTVVDCNLYPECVLTIRYYEIESVSQSI